MTQKKLNIKKIFAVQNLSTVFLTVSDCQVTRKNHNHFNLESCNDAFLKIKTWKIKYVAF